MSFASDFGISLCMIVRDEEHCIETVLSASRPYVDEIVVIDTGSTDKTIEIATRYADILEHFSWVNDFAAARNYSLEFATHPWILVLDADEVVDPAGMQSLQALARRENIDGFYLTQRLYQNNESGNDALWIPITQPNSYSKDYRGYRENKLVRLFRNSPDIRFAGKIHEIVGHTIADQRLSDSNIPIHHYHEKTSNETERHVLRNLVIQETLIESGEASGRDYLSAGAAHLRRTNDYEKASLYLSKALELGEDAGTALEALAESFYRQGQFESATKIYEDLYKASKGSSAVMNNLSNLRVKAGDLAGAVVLLEELLQRGISDPLRRKRIEGNLAALQQSLRDD